MARKNKGNGNEKPEPPKRRKVRGCSHDHTTTEDWETPGVTRPYKIHKVSCDDCGEILEWDVK